MDEERSVQHHALAPHSIVNLVFLSTEPDDQNRPHWLFRCLHERKQLPSAILCWQPTLGQSFQTMMLKV